MNLTSLQIAIDPTSAQDGAGKVRAALKSIGDEAAKAQASVTQSVSKQASATTEAVSKAARQQVSIERGAAAELAAIQRQKQQAFFSALEAQTTRQSQADANQRAAAQEQARQQAAARQHARQAQQEAQAAATAHRATAQGLGNMRTSVMQLLTQLSIVSPAMNRVMLAITGIGAAATLASVSILALGAGLATLGGMVAVVTALALAWKGLKQAAQDETIERRLATVVGGFREASERMDELRSLQRDAPLFPLEDLAKANEALHDLSNGALAGEDSMRMIANAALQTQKPIEDIAVGIGRFHRALTGDGDIREYVNELIRLRIISTETGREMLRMRDSGASPAAIWRLAKESLDRYNGAIEHYGSTFESTLARLRVTWGQLLSELGKPLLEPAKLALDALQRQVEGMIPTMQTIGRLATDALRTGDWTSLWDYVAAKFELAMKTAGNNFVTWIGATLATQWKKSIDDTMTQIKELPGHATDIITGGGTGGSSGGNLFNLGRSGSVTTTGGVNRGDLAPLPTNDGVAGIVQSDNPLFDTNALLEKIAGYEAASTAEAYAAAYENAWNEIAGGAGIPGAAPQGELIEPKEVRRATAVHSSSPTTVRTDETVMREFFAEMRVLTSGLQSGHVSSREFATRSAKMKDSAVNELGDPSRWKSALGEWRVAQEEKARISEETQRRIQSGEASMTESIMGGMTQMVDSWGNASQQIANAAGQITQSIANNMSQAISDWATGAKSAKEAFKDMAVGILKDIARIITQLLVELAVQYAVNAARGYFNGGSVGNAAGEAQYAANSVPVAQPVAYATGGGVTGGRGGIDDIPAYLTRGEYVLNRSAASYYGRDTLDSMNARQIARFASGGSVASSTPRSSQSSSGVSVTVNVDARSEGQGGGTKADDAKRAAALAKQIEASVVQILVREKRQEGVLRKR